MTEMQYNTPVKEESTEINLVELFQMWLSKWYVILIGLIIGAVLAGFLTNMQTPEYESSATLYVFNTENSSTSMSDIQIGAALSNDFVIIATSNPVLDAAVEKVNKDYAANLTRNNVKNMITVKNISNTRLLSITVRYTDPVIAYEVATAVTEATMQQMAVIMKTDSPFMVESAELPVQPVGNGMIRNILIGAFLGAVLVAAVYLVVYLVDDTVHGVEDFERYLGVTVIGMVPFDKAAAAQKNLHRPAEKRHKKIK